jgi:uncharacterized protein with ParB-like and HNH nuclease domain
MLKADFRYKVPPHQRNFAWTLDEVRQLWDDITGAIDEDLPEYFLGTIVVQENSDKKLRSIIDGQQRLATLAMVFSAIRSVYEEKSDERAREIHSEYLGVKDRRTRLTEPRLTLNEVNQEVFQRLVVDSAPDDLFRQTIANKTLSPSNILLAEAAQWIRNAVRQRLQGESKYETFLLELEDFVRDRLVAILVRVGDDADAYLIFETLNDRGLELSISDLLKNYIFSRAGNRLDLVRQQWRETVFILGTQDQTQFLRHYWLSKYGVIRERDLYKEMKRKFSSQNAALRLMSELREAADTYAAISNVDHPIWKGYATSVRKDLETLQLFALTQFRPLLLAVMESLKSNEIEKVVRMIVVVSVRYNIICSLSTGTLEKAYSDAAIQVRKAKVDTAAKMFAVLRSIYPEDVRFEADFAEIEITKPKIARYVLREVANKRQGSKELKVFEDERVVTLEHIMPKTRTKEWVKAAKDEEAYLAHVHRIGNLALIEREKNRATSTASFAKKKEDAFSQSGILLTRDLCKYSEWTVAEIVTRQAELAKLAARAWRLPY